VDRARPSVLLVTGSKDCGKTTLVVELIRRLRRPGRVLLAFKRATAVTRVDEPGTDTSRFAEAGAQVTGLTWPSGTYVASFDDDPRVPRATRCLERPSSLAELTGLATELGPGAGEVVVLAEGFSDEPHARVHVLARPGHRERPAGGPVLATWSLGGAGAGTVAGLVDVSLPLLARWSNHPGASGTVAAVLAGGQGHRLGGRDKWTLEVAGRRQSERSLGVLTRFFDRILIVGRRPPDPDPDDRTGGISGLVWLRDTVAGLGPLGGLLTALSGSEGRDVFAFAGDMPLLSGPLILHMLFGARRSAGGFDVLLPTWTPADARGGGDAAGARPAPGHPYSEPLHAVYTERCRERLETLRSTGGLAQRRLTEVFEGLAVLRVPESEIRLFGDPELLFLNLNTPADLARAEAILGPRG